MHLLALGFFPLPDLQFQAFAANPYIFVILIDDLPAGSENRWLLMCLKFQFFWAELLDFIGANCYSTYEWRVSQVISFFKSKSSRTSNKERIQVTTRGFL